MDTSRAALERLTVAIDDERDALEALLRRVIAVRLILEADEHRFIAVCLDEVAEASARLCSRSAERHAVVAALAALPPSHPTLAQCAAAAPEPLRWMLTDHREALSALLDELRTELAACRRLAHRARSVAVTPLDEGVAAHLELRRQAYGGVLATLRGLMTRELPHFVGAVN